MPPIAIWSREKGRRKLCIFF